MIITGVERFSNYQGYSDTFKWAGPFKDTSQRDKHNRLRTKIVAMDALCYETEAEQFDKKPIIRELNKAYTAFISPSPNSSCIATGNWGCGAFKGDPQLKAVIQLMVAAQVNRSVYYFTWGDQKLAEEFRQLYITLTASAITVGNLMEAVIQFCDQLKQGRNLELFQWLQEYFLSFEDSGRF